MVDNETSRRSFVKLGLAVGAGAGLFALAGCSPSNSSAANTASTPPTPRKGGSLRIGITGGGTADTLNPLTAITQADYVRVYSLYEPLSRIAADGSHELVLAESITSDDTAMNWTVKLRRGVVFHDGREMTSADVVSTFQTMLDPKNPSTAAAGLAAVDRTGIRAVDKYTVAFPCHSPFSTFAETLGTNGYSIVLPVGWDPKKPNGTGPFRYQAFTPGQSSTFVRNANYWRDGLPYLDQVVITNYADETSQVNALLGGQIDAAPLLSSDSLAQVTSGNKKTVVSPGGGFNPFTMRVDTAPFDDVHVRQALRLAVDRNQFMQLTYGGHGTIGNDIPGIWDKAYDHGIPQREHDVNEAKSLLRKAGHKKLSLDLVASSVAQGTIKGAQVLAQQYAEAGIALNIHQVTPTDFYGSGYLGYPFAMDYWANNSYFPQVAFTYLKSSPFNACHLNDPAYDALYQQAVSTVDESARDEIAAKMQKIEWERGGYIIPCFPAVIDGLNPNVYGFEKSKSGTPLNSFNFSNIYFA